MVTPLEKDLPPQQLTPEELASTKNAIQVYLEEIFDGIHAQNKFQCAQEIFDCAPLPEEEKEDIKNGINNEKSKQIIDVFLTQLLQFIETKKKNLTEKDQDKFPQFLDTIYNNFFSYTPHILSYLNIEHQLKFCATATRIDEIQTWGIGAAMMGEFVLVLKSCSKRDLKMILDNFTDKPVSEILDLVHLLHSIAARALANGEWAENACQNTLHLLTEIDRLYPIPFVHYAVENSRKKIAQERIAPTQSIFVFHTPESGRSKEFLEDEDQITHESLIRKITTKERIKPSDKLLPIAKDAIALFNHSNLPQKFALCAVDQLPSAQDIPPLDIERALEALHFQSINEQERNQLFIFIQSQVFTKTHPNNVFEKWHQIGPFLSSEEWKNYFGSLKKAAELKTHLHALQEKLEKERKKKFVERFLQSVSHLNAEQLSAFQISQNKISYIKQLQQERKFHEAFTEAYEIVRFKCIIEHTRRAVTTHTGGVSSFRDLRNDYEENKGEYLEILQRVEQEWTDFTHKMNLNLADYETLNAEMEEQFETLRQNLVAELQYLKNELFASLPHITFQDYEEIPNQSLLNPFPNAQDTDLPLLLQHLHSPRMRKMIEADLGCQLKEMKLRSQIHLLRFLQNKDHRVFQKLRKILETHPDNKQNILHTFLACAGDPELGNSILDLAENPKAQKLFEVYAEIIEIMDEKEAIITQNLSTPTQKNYFNEKRFYAAVLKRGVALIKEASTLNETDDFNAFLERAKAYHQDVIAWGALFSAISKTEEGKTVDPAAINELAKNIEIHVVNGGNLVQDESRTAMGKEENYLDISRFGPKDYVMIVQNLRPSYSKIDPNWLEYLIDNIPRDLNNSDVHFIMIRNRKKNNALIGVVKFKPDPDEPGTFYIGTLYVNPEFQKDFGIGEYLQQVVASLLPPGSKYWGSVALANPTLERHIDVIGGTATGIIKEGDDKNQSSNLFQVKFNHGYNFVSRTNPRFTKEFIKTMAEKGAGLKNALKNFPEAKNMKIHKIDSSPENNEKLSQLCKEYFRQGYAVTRYFYDQKDTGPDLKNIYLVFEKIPHQSKEDPPKADTFAA